MLLCLAAAVFYFAGRLSSERGLFVFCAASQQVPLQKIAAQFEKERGIRVMLQFGGTGSLLSQIRLTKKGDIFIAADLGALTDAGDAVKSSVPIVAQKPVIAVKEGNPKQIHLLEDLLRNDVRLALANPETASISRVCRKLLGERWAALQRKAAVLKPSVVEIASDVKLGAADAAIVWDTVVMQGLSAIQTQELSTHSEPVSAALLASSTQQEIALQFIDFLTHPDHGGMIFRESGMHPISSAQP
jgi:molybdate transport system substrate-binding protein